MSLGLDLGHLTGHDGDDGLVAVGGDVVDVVHLAAVDQGETVEDVEVLPAEEEQALRRVESLDAAGAVHVGDFFALFEKSERMHFS